MPLMRSLKTTDIWQVGILPAPITHCLDPQGLKDIAIHWLPPQPDFCFLADPFGVWQGEVLTVFVEAYDYRDKKGVIHYYCYEQQFQHEACPPLRGGRRVVFNSSAAALRSKNPSIFPTPMCLKQQARSTCSLKPAKAAS